MKLIQCCIIIPAFLLISSCSTTEYQANRPAKPVKVDGIPSEWSLPLRVSDVKSELQYNITNDAGNLYVCIRATEPSTQRKILAAGMEVWIDASGKNKHVSGIRFPLPASRERAPDEMVMSLPNAPRERDLKKKYFSSYHQMELSGFAPAFNGLVAPDNDKGIKASVNWDSLNIMTYELVVPLRAFYDKDLSSLSESPVFGMEIIVNAPTFPQKGGSTYGGGRSHPAGGAEGGEMEGGGGSMGGRGGMGGMGGGGRRGEKMGGREGAGENSSGSMSESNSIKFKIRLAK